MFIDSYGNVGREHARDLRRETCNHRPYSKTAMQSFRDFLARTQLGPSDNYRVR